MFGFGIVLSIEHSSTLQQHLDCLVLAAAKDRPLRLASRLLSALRRART